MKRIILFLLTAALLMISINVLAVDGKQLSVQMTNKSAYLDQGSMQRCIFKCKYVNNHPTKIVSGLDLVYRTLDRNRIMSEEVTQHIPIQIDPLAQTSAQTIYITNQQEVAFLIISVQTVFFTDGTSEAIDFARGENYNPSYFSLLTEEANQNE